jgi:hypothetical protein
MARWKFVVTDLMYNPIGELSDFYDMTLNRRLNGGDSMSFRVRYDNPFFYTLSTQEACIKAYRDGVLQFFGNVWTADISGTSETCSLAVSVAAPFLRADKMFGNAADSYVNTTQNYAGTRAIAPFMIYWGYTLFQNAMTAVPGHSALPADVETYATNPLAVESRLVLGDWEGYYPNVTSAIRYTKAPFESLATALTATSSTSVGFDWYWKPTEPTYMQTDSSPYFQVYNPTNIYAQPSWPVAKTIALLRAENVIGYDMSATAVFGSNSNLAEYKLTSTRETQANNIAQKPAATVYQGVDSASRLKWGSMDVADPFSSMDSPALVQALLDRAVSLRKNPLRRLEITPVASYPGSGMPNFGTDYFLGDIIGIRLTLPNGVKIVPSGYARVHGVTFNFTEGGAEKIALTITEQSA